MKTQFSFSSLMRKLDESVLLFINHSVIVFSVCMDNSGESILSRVQWSRASKDAEWRALRLLFPPPIHGCFLAGILVNLSLFPLFSLFTTVTFRVCSFMVLENLNDLGTILFSIAVSFFFFFGMAFQVACIFFFSILNKTIDSMSLQGMLLVCLHIIGPELVWTRRKQRYTESGFPSGAIPLLGALFN